MKQINLNAIIVGRSGRMGKEIEAVAPDFGLTIIDGVGRERDLSGCLASAKNGKIFVHVVIDFSLPVATPEVLQACASASVPLVSGVTGLTSSEFRLIEEASQKIPILHSANMSLGIQILAKAFESLKGADGFDISIEEFHHRHKRDRPSGTALLLDDELQIRTGRRASEIVSLRGGGIVGEHRVYVMSDSEVLTFSHQALNRAVFARGACRAARWISGRKPGFYALKDLLEKA
jgi:4-hydroxy-tetrahydrodipicolinate reductase